MSTKQSLFEEINSCLLEDEKPSARLRILFNLPICRQQPFVMITRLRSTDQSPKHHPEGNVWNHTLLVVDEAAKVKEKSSNPAVFMWAALLHDIGKPDTMRKKEDRITFYNHEIASEQLSDRFLKEFTNDYDFIDKVKSLVRFHMQILYVVNDLPFAHISEMKTKTDLNEVALLGFCDRMGRTGADSEKEQKTIQIFLEKCK